MPASLQSQGDAQWHAVLELHDLSRQRLPPDYGDGGTKLQKVAKTARRQRGALLTLRAPTCE